ncbi:MAG: type II toxin-antitoxin system prevent-host-death family antitoxin [Hydrogenophilales bacterium]|nr:type II toxin-antitoxin system prevent-host-death family antitoxin [Hydrogenophilales bacterium]
MRRVSLADAKAHLSAVVDEVEAGEEIVITRRGQPVARIVAERKRPAGNAAALVKELRAFVTAQPLQPESAVKLVRRMRDGARY